MMLEQMRGAIRPGVDVAEIKMEGWVSSAQSSGFSPWRRNKVEHLFMLKMDQFDQSLLYPVSSQVWAQPKTGDEVKVYLTVYLIILLHTVNNVYEYMR